VQSYEDKHCLKSDFSARQHYAKFDYLCEGLVAARCRAIGYRPWPVRPMVCPSLGWSSQKQL